MFDFFKRDDLSFFILLIAVVILVFISRGGSHGPFLGRSKKEERENESSKKIFSVLYSRPVEKIKKEDGEKVEKEEEVEAAVLYDRSLGKEKEEEYKALYTRTLG